MHLRNGLWGRVWWHRKQTSLKIPAYDYSGLGRWSPCRVVMGGNLWSFDRNLWVWIRNTETGWIIFHILLFREEDKNASHFWIEVFYKRMDHLQPLFVYFCLFKQTLQFAQQINVKKFPSSIQCWDSNPQPLELESPPIANRPGLTRI